MDLFIGLVLAVLSSFLIAKACDGFEEAADYLGRNMTEGTKGATINAIGSSMPELWVTVIYLFFFMDTTGIAGGIGTTAGSAVFNAMVIPALVIIFVLRKNSDTKIILSRPVIIRDGLTLITAEFFLIYFIGNTLEWYHGFFLMLIYISYASWMIFRHKSANNGGLEKESIEEENETEEEFNDASRLLALFKVDLEHAIIGNNEIKTGNALGLLGISTVFIVVACWILVYSCETIGFSLGIHGYFISVIIAAAASSVPDTILSVKDAGKGNYDDAVANALGSNIFDICFALGAPLFIFTLIYGPIVMDAIVAENITELRILLLVLTIITFFLFLIYKQMTKNLAYTLLAMYGVFVAFVAGKAYENPLALEVSRILQTIQNVIF